MENLFRKRENGHHFRLRVYKVMEPEDFGPNKVLETAARLTPESLRTVPQRASFGPYGSREEAKSNIEIHQANLNNPNINNDGRKRVLRIEQETF